MSYVTRFYEAKYHRKHLSKVSSAEKIYLYKSQSTLFDLPKKLNLQQLLTRGIELYEIGDLGASQLAFQQIADADPNNFDALTYLGRIAARRELLSEACVWFSKAASQPRATAQVHYELGCFLELQAKTNIDLSIALDSYNRAVLLDINHHEAFFNKANIHKRLGEVEQALHAYNEAILINHLNPYYFNNRGDLLLNLRSLPFSLKDFEQAIELDPSITYFHDSRGSVLKELKRYDDSSQSFKRSLAIDPENAFTYNNFGSLFLEREVWDKALACFEMALRINPNFFHALYNKGLLYQRFNLFDNALSCYQKALSILPSSIDVRWNIAIIQLTRGDLKNGLIGYEQRLRLPENRGYAPITTKPQLTRAIKAERILVWNEHGLGNEIFFANFLRHPEFSSKEIIAKFDPRLHELLNNSFTTHPNIRIIGAWEDTNENEYDAHIGLASLLYYLGIDEPQSQQWGKWSSPYLKVLNEKNSLRIREYFSDLGGISVIQTTDQTLKGPNKLRVGISWQSVNQKTGTRRSIALKTLMTLFDGLEVQLINLQYGDVQVEIDEVNQENYERRTAIETGASKVTSSTPDFFSDIHQYKEIDNFFDINGLSELIGACDLVISVDNSTLHLCSAMGKPTCALIPFVADWRWFLEKDVTPWYQNTKLYRQEKAGSWDRPLSRLREDLLRIIKTR